MAWVVKLTSPSGEVYYGSEPDYEGLRYRMTTPNGAERFESKQKAEAVFYWFRQIRDISDYQYEAVETD